METRKQYITPNIRIYDIAPQELLLGTSGVENIDFDLDYGGIDDYGELEVD